MRSGWSGGIGVVCLLALAFVLSGGEVPLYINGDPVFLAHPVLQENGHFLVPLSELGLLLGIEVSSIDKEGLISLRWGGGRQCFSSDYFPCQAGLCYISLDELTTLVGASVHTIGEEIYIEAEPGSLTFLEARADGVTARFDTFVPYEALEMGPETFHLRFYHCSLSTAPRQIALGEGPVTSVRLSAPARGRADLVIEVLSDSLPQIKRLEIPGFYSVSLAFDQQPHTETQVELLPHITYYEIETDLGEGPVAIEYLYVEGWREHYRLTPAVSENGVGTLASLSQMARTHGAHAAINANFFDTATHNPIGLLIVNGVVQSSNYERRAALGIDLFGRLTFFSPIVSLYLRLGEKKIPIDDVNRPIKSGELIVYTEGYAGEITRGATRSFRIVKVRADRVVAVQDSPYVPEASATTLLVGSGIARDRLATATLGDAVSIEYTLDQGDLLITDAVSAGPLLIRDGTAVLDPEAESFKLDSYLVNGLAARSVLATDWYGGLILLAVVKDKESVGADFENLLSVLDSLPVPVKDAIAFDGGHSSSLVIKDGVTYRELSSGGKVAAGLLLVPIGR